MLETHLFNLGRIVGTTGALNRLNHSDVFECLKRHTSGDWGLLSKEDRQFNDWALLEEARLLSAYQDSNGTAFWIITEADRSSTTILLPEEY